MTLSRRELIIAGLSTAAVGCTSSATEPIAAPATSEAPSATTSSTTTQAPTPTPVEPPGYEGTDPFALGVASGDPDATSFVVWTRLLTAFDATGPFASDDAELAIDVAEDAEFGVLVSSDLVTAPATHGHSVHAIIDGLDADRWYWYRFRIGEHVSPTGRARTVPASGSEPLRFGFSSCQNWESGAYAAHRHLAEADLDLFVWLGDYIYEYGPGNQGVVSSAGEREHNSPEVDTLDGYRQRYALYKSDPNLQAHHAARPWIVTWDDHEVDNNHAGASPEDDQDQAVFLERKQAAYQAWWENMPVRVDPPIDGEFTIYRSIAWGDLLDLHMLDGRQYRSPQAEDGEAIALPGVGDFGVRLLSPTALDSAQTMLGPTQRAWLEGQVAASAATWNVLGNQVFMHGLNALPGTTPAINTDTWDGYFGERLELLNSLTTNSDNLVVLSGDFHAASVGDVRADPFDPKSPVIATEFMAPAISSTFPDSLRTLAPLVLGINPQVRHFSPDNGFMTCEVTSAEWTTTLHLLDDVTSEASSVGEAAVFTVLAGAPGVDTIVENT